MDLTGTKTVVIGGAGLIGSHLVEQLLEQDVREVLVYDNFARGTRANLSGALGDSRLSLGDAGGDILHRDVLRGALEGAGCVFHLAALWLLHCEEYPRAAFEVNMAGTFNVLEACVEAGVTKLVYSSSASVYGDALDVPMDEDHPYNNTTVYGATKIAGEHLCHAFHHRYGLDYVALRYMNVYGERQDYRGAYIAVILRMLDRLDQGLAPVIHGDGSQRYDFVHVSDVAAANLCAARSAATSGAYNVGTGIGTSIRELAELLIELTDAGLTPEFAEARPSFVSHRIASPDRAKRELGFEARVGLREGLVRLIEWRQDQLDQERARAASPGPLA